MLDLENTPPLRGRRPEGSTRARRPIPQLPGISERLSRRTILGGLLAAGSALGVTALGVFPPARKALADGYDIKSLPCPSYAANHDCSPGCGPSETCALTGWCCGSDGYHRNTAEYHLRPNECYGGWADGWLWRYAASCGGCSAVTYRCHDGFTVTWAGPWVKTICRWRTSCG